jgi:uncharacterized membrane protein
MPFCASCGTQVDGKFCPKCGAAIVAGGAAPPPGSAPYVTPGSAPYAAPVSAPMADNVAATLCYVLGLITGIIFLVLEPYSKNRTIRFHAFQSIFLNVAVIIIEIVMAIVFRILLEIMGFFGLIAGIFFPIFGLCCLCLWLYLLYMTYQGNTVVLPVIGPLAQKQAQS